MKLASLWQAPLLIVVVAALAGFPLVANGYYLALGVSMLSYVVLATAWALFSGPTRYVSLATAAFFGIGAYTMAVLEMWDAQMAAFAGKYRCLRYDTRGHGRSETVDEAITIDDLADDLAGLLDALRIDKAHVVGLSLGGMTGQAFAVRHPDRIDRLGLLATTAQMAVKKDWEDRAALVLREGYGSFVDGVMSPRWFTADYALAHPDVVAGFRQRMLANSRAGYAVCCHVIANLDLPARIGAVAAPTLIMVGADDPATPVPMSEAMRSLIHGAEMVVVPHAAHIVAVEKAAIVNAYLGEFLGRGRRAEASPTGGATFETGLRNRKAVLGADYVERSLKAAGDFGATWQDFITRTAWGEVWGDPTLPWKTRSLVTLAVMATLNREQEFKLHVRPALANGVTLDELKALLLQVGVYAGDPAGNSAMRWVRDVLGEALG